MLVWFYLVQMTGLEVGEVGLIYITGSELAIHMCMISDRIELCFPRSSKNFQSLNMLLLGPT